MTTPQEFARLAPVCWVCGMPAVWRITSNQMELPDDVGCHVLIQLTACENHKQERPDSIQVNWEALAKQESLTK